MTEQRDWLDGKKFVQFLRDNGLKYKYEVGERYERRLTDWEKGSKAGIYTALDVMTHLGLYEHEIPDDLWVDSPRRPNLTPEQREEAVSRVLDGEGISEVARAFGCNQRAVRYHVAKAAA